MNYTIIANSGFYSISGKDIDFFTSFLSAEAGSFIMTDSYSEIKDFEVISGIFRQMVLLTSTAEDSEITDFEVTSGVFSKVVIDYTYGLPENSEIKNFSVTGGVHATV
jgi:hypothetical protein